MARPPGRGRRRRPTTGRCAAQAGGRPPAGIYPSCQRLPSCFTCRLYSAARGTFDTWRWLALRLWLRAGISGVAFGAIQVSVLMGRLYFSANRIGARAVRPAGRSRAVRTWLKSINCARCPRRGWGRGWGGEGRTPRVLPGVTCFQEPSPRLAWPPAPQSVALNTLQMKILRRQDKRESQGRGRKLVHIPQCCLPDR